MTELQCSIAERILKIIKENGNVASWDVISHALYQSFDYKAGMDINYVINQFVDDYKLLRREGVFYMLTREGERAAKRGFAFYVRTQTWSDWWRENSLAALIIGAASSALTVLITQLLS